MKIPTTFARSATATKTTMATTSSSSSSLPSASTGGPIPFASVTSDDGWLPSARTSASLFVAGSTVGPVVDSLHNQCLLKYDIAPITVNWPSALPPPSDAVYAVAADAGSALPLSASPLLCTSWVVPPLLGVAYVVLGGILPRVFQRLLRRPPKRSTGVEVGAGESTFSFPPGGNRTPSPYATQMQEMATPTSSKLRNRAVIAVLTTAAIIKLSEFLQTHPDAFLLPGFLGDLAGSGSVGSSDQHVFLLLAIAALQWALLDGTVPALLAASITSVGGPLSELWFVSHGFWEYLPSAGDYLPLAGSDFPSVVDSLFLSFFGQDDYHQLALSSITGPCYFAVTMDAIALGRWFDASMAESEIAGNTKQR